MPLSEDEQRILQEIEANLTATDPALAEQVSQTTIYRHTARTIRWAFIGVVAGLAWMLITFTRSVWLGATGFLAMLACLLIIERNVRKMGKAGIDSLTQSLRSGNLGGPVGDFGKRFRERWHRDDS